jgi:hypothetical protein
LVASGAMDARDLGAKGAAGGNVYLIALACMLGVLPMFPQKTSRLDTWESNGNTFNAEFAHKVCMHSLPISSCCVLHAITCASGSGEHIDVGSHEKFGMQHPAPSSSRGSCAPHPCTACALLAGHLPDRHDPPGAAAASAAGGNLWLPIFRVTQPYITMSSHLLA